MSRLKVQVAPAPHRDGATLPSLPNPRLLVPEDLSVAELGYVLRRRLKVEARDALFLLDENGRLLVTPHALVRDVHAARADKDGILHLRYAPENCFGAVTSPRPRA